MRGATINGRPAEQVFDALRGDIPGVIKSMEDNRADTSGRDFHAWP